MTVTSSSAGSLLPSSSPPHATRASSATPTPIVLIPARMALLVWRPLVAVNLVGRIAAPCANLPGVERRAELSLSEWAVLGVLVERPRHGYDIAAALSPDAAVGRAWRVRRQLVYRALERLEALALVEPRRTEPGAAAPPRTVYGPTRRGRATLHRWLDTPVDHLRDVRSALLLKLVLLEALGRSREAGRRAASGVRAAHRRRGGPPGPMTTSYGPGAGSRPSPSTPSSRPSGETSRSVSLSTACRC